MSRDVELIKSDDSIEIKTQHNSDIFNIIISSINVYLRNNFGAVSDYHLIKDIVDRNCDSKEEEIHAQIPVPLYLGLAGTMLGILIGIGFLVFSGGLNHLLNSGDGIAGSEGIETLLGGVALAMISSIVGIILTTIASQSTKNVKIEVESSKNSFLSWIQAELMPNLSSDTSSALISMTKNLSDFNKTFSKNTEKLGEILGKITESYEKHNEVIQSIDELKITEIATANLTVYEKLKNCTKELGTFGEHIQSANQYLSAIQSLSQKLDEYEKRTQVIESAGKFFAKNEKWLAETLDGANLEVQGAIKRFEKDTKDHLKSLQESLSGQLLKFDEFTTEQQTKLTNALENTDVMFAKNLALTNETFEKNIAEHQKAFLSNISEFTGIVEELKNLKDIKKEIGEFKGSTDKLNSKVDTLANEIRSTTTANRVVSVGESTITPSEQNLKIDKLASEVHSLSMQISENDYMKVITRIPNWLKVLIFSCSGLIILSCIFYIVSVLIELITNK